ncbi:hypothetical protein BRY73_24760 [Ochrobactrum sp. P6BS-III]|nr:hypothetical protein BRY73_24760 [Ochrobactrum sp. P6BS-III]
MSSQITRRIWFRASLFSVLAIVTALLAIVLKPYIPADLSTRIGADAVDNVLGILATSMLTVTTFSLSTMVSAYSAATNNVTPRATKLVMEDSSTQNMLSTFVGAFLFSLVGIIALSTGAYGDSGRAILFLVTIIVIAVIVITLLRWIDHLAKLGRVAETTQRVEKVAIAAMRTWHRKPNLGCQIWDGTSGLTQNAMPISVPQIGYVQHIDAARLSAIAAKAQGRIFLRVIPGLLVAPTEPVGWLNCPDPSDHSDAIKNCITIGESRSFDQDPRFGATVLAEIASRALSPAVNDPGTAIDVIARALRILAVWNEPIEIENKIDYPEVFLKPLIIDDLFDDLFTPIGRDGAGLVEVGLRLQKAFGILARFNGERYKLNALRHSKDALSRAEHSLTSDIDKDRIKNAARKVWEGPEIPARPFLRPR